MDVPEMEKKYSGESGDGEEKLKLEVDTDTDELAAFRSQWREELGLPTCPSADDTTVHIPSMTMADNEGSSSNSNTPQKQLLYKDAEESSHSPPHNEPEDLETEAIRLYWMGVAAEQSGDMDGAILYYRQAMQLDPDVETKASQNGPPVTISELEEGVIEAENCESNLLAELTDAFQSLSVTTFCQPRKQTKECHISSLPVEVLRYIFRWVVSSWLDMRAIEQISLVCRGFYILAREPQLWRIACRKLWGDSCQPGTYGSWRKMFILKPHLHFNGVYISKTSYVRQGEHSLDGFYKPYHTVTYYRLIRFFADGCVMYQTTPEEPKQVVSRLCHKHSSEGVLLGSYQVQDRKILIDVKLEQSHHHHHHRGRRRDRSKQQEITQEHRFHMELLLSKRKTKQLTWIEHYCSTVHIPTGQEQITQFPIDYMYTPFYFSRVKSYTSNSVGILTE